MVAMAKLQGLNAGQLRKAIKSLLTYIGKQQAESTELLADEEELALKKMPLQSRKDTPVPLPLPHPLATPEGAQICLFVKDHQGEGHKEAKKRLEQFERRGGIAKVIGVSKLKTKYESHESKRELCKMYDLFLADERIIPILPKLIGKFFFKKKKQPIPVKLTAKEFPAQVKKACSATYLFKNSGTCINLKVGHSTMTAQQIHENIMAALGQAVEHIPKKWANVQGVFVKTAESIALPVYQTLPDAPLRISTEAKAATSELKLESAPPAKKAATTPAATTTAPAVKIAGTRSNTAAAAKAGSKAAAAPSKPAGVQKKAAAPAKGKKGK